MTKDRRYITVKNLISGGYIKTFREIFDTLPKSVVAKDLGMNNVRISKLIENVDLFALKDVFRIASLIEVENIAILTLINDQYLLDRMGKRKK